MTDSMASYKGRQDFFKGLSRSDNPYDMKDEPSEYMEWDYAWCRASQQQEFEDLMGWG